MSWCSCDPDERKHNIAVHTRARTPPLQGLLLLLFISSWRCGGVAAPDHECYDHDCHNNATALKNHWQADTKSRGACVASHHNATQHRVEQLLDGEATGQGVPTETGWQASCRRGGGNHGVLMGRRRVVGRCGVCLLLSIVDDPRCSTHHPPRNPHAVRNGADAAAGAVHTPCAQVDNARPSAQDVSKWVGKAHHKQTRRLDGVESNKRRLDHARR